MVNKSHMNYEFTGKFWPMANGWGWLDFAVLHSKELTLVTEQN